MNHISKSQDFEFHNLKLSNLSRNEAIDKYLEQFCYKLKLIVDKHGEYGYSSMSSFLYPVLDDFSNFLENWKNDRNNSI